MKDNNENIGFQWMKFAGLASQWAIALICLMFLGKYLDQKHFFSFSKPLFTWLFPFSFIFFSLINLIKETNNKSNFK